MNDQRDLEPNYSAQHRTHDPGLAMAELARRQHGGVAREQLVGLGLGRHANRAKLELTVPRERRHLG